MSSVTAAPSSKNPFALSVAKRSFAKSKRGVRVHFDFAPAALRSVRTDIFRDPTVKAVS